MELGQNLVETKNNNLIKVEFPFLYTYYNMVLPKAIPPFFFRLASTAFPDIGSDDPIEKKIIKIKKSQEVLEPGALVPQDDVKS